MLQKGGETMKGLLESSSHNLSSMLGETVTIFTQSGGCSGQGFTGVVISCNECFVRLVTSFGSAPDNVFGTTRSICDCNCKSCRNSGFCDGDDKHFKVGSVIDIPVEKIVAFAHNAL